MSKPGRLSSVSSWAKHLETYESRDTDSLTETFTNIDIIMLLLASNILKSLKEWISVKVIGLQ